MTEKKYPNLRLLTQSFKGHYFGAYVHAGKDAEKGHDFFISKTEGEKDWCDCRGFVHGNICYHIKDAKKRFEQRGDGKKE